MITIIGFLSSTIGRVLVSVAGALALWVAFASHYEGKGAAKAVSEMKEATNNATSKGKLAADRSRSDGVRGKTDPGYRD